MGRFLHKDGDGHGCASQPPGPLQFLPENIIKTLQSADGPFRSTHPNTDDETLVNGLPRRITFPYSRHSSLAELRHLVKTLNPKDVWPCTYNFHIWEAKGYTIRSLFGDCCSGVVFAHDSFAERLRNNSQIAEGTASTDPEDTQRTASSRHVVSSPAQPSSDRHEPEDGIDRADSSQPVTLATEHPSISAVDDQESFCLPGEAAVGEPPRQATKRTYEEFHGDHESHNSESQPDLQDDSQGSSLSAYEYETRLRAFRAAQDMLGRDELNVIGLISTTDHHTIPEEELGGP